jgi:hypothetical protein
VLQTFARPEKVLVKIGFELAASKKRERAGLPNEGKKDLMPPYPFAFNDIQGQCRANSKQAQAHAVHRNQC